jgi:hypothetical protein
MPNTTTQNQTDTLTINVDADVAAYIEQQGITDINAYINQLLKAEQDRQKSGDTNKSQTGDYAPDASGYPNMKGHFASGVK